MSFRDPIYLNLKNKGKSNRGGSIALGRDDEKTQLERFFEKKIAEIEMSYQEILDQKCREIESLREQLEKVTIELQKAEGRAKNAVDENNRLSAEVRNIEEANQAYEKRIAELEEEVPII